MFFAAILAGGVGSRMKMADMPKQFLEIEGKPIIIYTLEKFLQSDKIQQIYIGVHPKWLEHMDSLVLKYAQDEKSRIHIVPGGEDRNSTLMNVINQMEDDFGVSDDHYIITHDSVRPFVTVDMIDANVDAVKKYLACDTVCPAVDTIVQSMDGDVIRDIPERKYLYQGQTPQSFQITLLKKLYEDLTNKEKELLTDACKICTVRKVPVHLVEGDVSNIKITTIGDYNIARAMIALSGGGKIG